MIKITVDHNGLGGTKLEVDGKSDDVAYECGMGIDAILTTMIRMADPERFDKLDKDEVASLKFSVGMDVLRANYEHMKIGKVTSVTDSEQEFVSGNPNPNPNLN